MFRRADLTDVSGAMETSPANPYLRDAVMTATPEQLQLMLYDGAIRFAIQAKDAILRQDFETSFEKLTRAQNIVLEMQNGLDFDVNPDLCKRMSAIYTFLYNKLVDANVQHETAAIDDAVRVLNIERETWQILVDRLGSLSVEQQETNSSEEQNQPADGAAPGATLSVEG